MTQSAFVCVFGEREMCLEAIPIFFLSLLSYFFVQSTEMNEHPSASWSISLDFINSIEVFSFYSERMKESKQ
jgi:hypothetical protein